MESDKLCAYHARVVKGSDAKHQPQDSEKWRRHCGCIKTSEKLRQILRSFPSAPPPTPSLYEQTCVAAYTRSSQATDQPRLPPGPPLITHIAKPELATVEFNEPPNYADSKLSNRTWQIIAELVHLVQLSVTATALALYYVIYCYMQLIYYTLRSALYFHNADGPMKITIGVVTLTSVIVGFNLLIRMEKLIGIYLF